MGNVTLAPPDGDQLDLDIFGELDEAEEFYKEATVWVDGLDRINKTRAGTSTPGINFCVDLSATPYFLGRMGESSNRIFPWVVSDFGLNDAIEAGLVKIPQLAVRDSSGNPIPGYFNVWRWLLPQLTPAERGGTKGSPKPEAVLKWAYTPIVMLAGLWDSLRVAWEERHDDPRPPVFIIVCKNTKIAKVLYEWLAEDRPPSGIPGANIPALRNVPGRVSTIRVDSNVVHETDTGEPKSDESAWMRLTLDTVGRLAWPLDEQQRPVVPEGFVDLAGRLKRPLHPPGRDIRCIVSVGMLTEGWDCSTVTHIVGLRPFMSQLLCEQVVGRGLRRTSYEVGEDGLMTEEVAKVFGVPFEIVPFKAEPGVPPPKPERKHVMALPTRAEFELRFPRVEGYQQAINGRVAVDWAAIAPLKMDSATIPPEVEMKAQLVVNQGRPSLVGPGRIERVDLNPYRNGRRLQELTFELARDLTRGCAQLSSCRVPAHRLFPQLRAIVDRYLAEKVVPHPPYQTIDAFLSPYYGWIIEILSQALRPADSSDGPAELPRYESHRGPGTTAEVDFWTSRPVYQVTRSHVNYVVADTKRWEQSAAYHIDTSDDVAAFVKNAGLGFGIPYFRNGQMHDYAPDFLTRLKVPEERYLILETKGYDEAADDKAQAAHRWVAAVNADGRYGQWAYAMVHHPSEVPAAIADATRATTVLRLTD